MTEKDDKKSGGAAGWLVLILIVGAIGWFSSLSEDEQKKIVTDIKSTFERIGDSTDDDAEANSEAASSFDQQEVPQPKNRRGLKANTGNGGCLSVFTPNGANAYYVKLKRGKDTVWDLFLKPGADAVQMNVPRGNFTLAYGMGTTWYGWKHAFGPEGGYSVTPDPVAFQGGGRCWEFTLTAVPGGNLSPDEIDASQF